MSRRVYHRFLSPLNAPVFFQTPVYTYFLCDSGYSLCLVVTSALLVKMEIESQESLVLFENALHAQRGMKAPLSVGTGNVFAPEITAGGV